MEKEKESRKKSLRVKLNLMIIGIILMVSAGLHTICYHVYNNKAYEECEKRAVKAASLGSQSAYSEELSFFWDAIRSEEYQEVRRRAIEENDESILIDWLKARPSWAAIS